MGSPELRVNEAALSWDPAEVTVPEVPPTPAGPDAMALLVSAVMPTIATDVTQKVAETRAREDQFAANLVAARNAYRGTDGAGRDQINAAASGLSDPAGAAGSPAGSAAAAVGSGGGDAGLSQLSQLMGMAMQIGQQAVQAPAQAVGMAGQLPQTVMQGVQGIVEQATQASDKAGKDAKGADGAGADGEAGDQPSESAGEKPEDKDKKDYEKSEDEKKNEEKPVGAGPDQGQRAPVGDPHAQPSTPNEVPRHRQLTETSPEVAL